MGGQEYQIQLVYADNGSSTDKALTAATQLVSEGVSLVLGSYGSGVSIAAGPTFGNAGLPAIGVTCTNPMVTAGNDYYFRICFLDPFQGTVLANFAMEKFQAKTAYLLGEAGNEYDQGLINFFEQAFTAAGGKVIKDAFPTNNSDFNSYLNKAKAEGADVIFTPVSIAYATQIISQAASLGIDIPFLGSGHPGRQHGAGGRQGHRRAAVCVHLLSGGRQPLSLTRASRSTSTPPPALWRPTAETTPSPRCPPWAMTHTMWLWRPSRPPTRGPRRHQGRAVGCGA